MIQSPPLAGLDHKKIFLRVLRGSVVNLISKGANVIPKAQ
jgi:hypothetical protein